MADISFSRFSSLAEGTGTVRISGAKEMEALLLKLPDYLAKQVVTAALKKAAEPILEEARSLAPVGQESKGRVRLRQTRKGVTISNYGKLKLNLRISDISKYRPHDATVAVTIGKAFWGMFLEFGTRHQNAQPFMRPAFESKKMIALNRLGTFLGEGIEKAAQKLAGPLAKSGLRRR
jgi:HK97 gp10 family phage protein